MSGWVRSRSILSAGFSIGLIACSKNGPLEPPRVNDDVPTLSYAVELTKGMQNLVVHADFPRGTTTGWGVDRPALPFVVDLTIKPHGSALKYNWSDTGEEECKRRGCSVSYTFQLDRAAREIDSRRVVDYFGDTIVAPHSTWLLRPERPEGEFRQRFVVHTPSAFSFGTGTDPVPGEKNTYETHLPPRYHGPYAAFGPMRKEKLEVGQRELSIFLLSENKQPLEDEYLQWIKASAGAVARYYGEFPAEHTAVFLTPFDYHGSQMGIGGASVILGMSTGRVPAESGRMWVATHEMIHVGFPGTSRRHHWATEGIATYVEGVARAQAGLITRDELWSEFVSRLPEGQPTTRDRGLDVTHTWARTYWGGALFWFLADVEIGRATNGQKSLRDALRGLVQAGGNSKHYWPIRQTAETMDQAVGVDVVLPLYERHSQAAVPVRLNDIFSALGIDGEPGALTFNDRAKLAHIRRAIEGSR